jgi:hypothetical protein
MTKALVWILAVAALVICVVWMIADPVSGLILVFGLLSALLAAVGATAVLGALSWIAWRLLQPRWRDFYSKHRVRFVLVELVAIAFFVCVGFWLNRHWLPHRMHPMSLATDALVAVFTILLFWTLLTPSRRKLIMAVPVTLGFVVVALLFIGLAPDAGAGASDPARALTTLGYVTWVPTRSGSEDSGVVYYDSTKANPGINIYGPRSAPRAHLMDMKGEILHTWSFDVTGHDGWHHFELLPNGDLIAIVHQGYLICLDWDSNVRWVRRIRTHHDLSVTSSGEVFALTRVDRLVRIHGIPVPILDDQITVFTAAGGLKRTISLFDVVGDTVPRGDAWRVYSGLLNPLRMFRVLRNRSRYDYWLGQSMMADILHTNTVEVIDKDVDDVFRTGNLLVCVRDQDTIVVIDPATEKVVWSWGRGVLEWPHHPTLLDNGNLLIFDNGVRRRWTRVIELDPRTRKIVWRYRADEPGDFFSYTRGGNQRLPNGNTLITDSDSGHAFEVTPDGEIVWEFFTPETDESGKRRSAVYRLMRIVDPDEYPCIARVARLNRPESSERTVEP